MDDGRLIVSEERPAMGGDSQVEIAVAMLPSECIQFLLRNMELELFTDDALSRVDALFLNFRLHSLVNDLRSYPRKRTPSRACLTPVFCRATCNRRCWCKNCSTWCRMSCASALLPITPSTKSSA